MTWSGDVLNLKVINWMELDTKRTKMSLIALLKDSYYPLEHISSGIKFRLYMGLQLTFGT